MMRHCVFCKQWMHVEPRSQCERCGAMYVGAGWWVSGRMAKHLRREAQLAPATQDEAGE